MTSVKADMATIKIPHPTYYTIDACVLPMLLRMFGLRAVSRESAHKMFYNTYHTYNRVVAVHGRESWKKFECRCDAYERC